LPVETRLQAIRVVVIEDDHRTRSLIAQTIDEQRDMVCAGAFEGVESALEVASDPAEAMSPDVVLLDISLNGMSGVEGIRPLHQVWPRAEIVMVTVCADEDRVFEALCRGAIGYILKVTSPGEIVNCVRDAQGGGAPMTSSIARLVARYFSETAAVLDGLTGREQDVLDRIVQGKTNRQIAGELYVSDNTIAFHIKQIYRKLQVHSRAEAVAKAVHRRV